MKEALENLSPVRKMSRRTHPSGALHHLQKFGRVPQLSLMQMLTTIKIGMLTIYFQTSLRGKHIKNCISMMIWSRWRPLFLLVRLDAIMTNCTMFFKKAHSDAFRIVDRDSLQLKVGKDAFQKLFCGREGGSIPRKSARRLSELLSLDATNVLNECCQKLNTYLCTVDINKLKHCPETSLLTKGTMEEWFNNNHRNYSVCFRCQPNGFIYIALTVRTFRNMICN